jgi:homoserine kinase type II
MLITILFIISLIKLYKFINKEIIKLMAVYTKVNFAEANEFLQKYYSIKDLKELIEIPQGVENTNYILVTKNKKFILTLYENRVSYGDLPFFINLMVALNHKNIECPNPVKMKNGSYTELLNNKHAAIFSFLPGKSTIAIKNEHCFLVGQTLANIHLKTTDLSLYRENTLSIKYWSDLLNLINKTPRDTDDKLYMDISNEYDFLMNNWPSDLPRGIIHGDLFPDNIFFQNNKLTGVIDFYFACDEFYIFDIAICINAWCFESDYSFNITKASHLLKGYTSLKNLTENEVQFLPIMCRGSALRFLLTRLVDWNKRDENVLVTPKDPSEYYNKLQFHQSVTSSTDYGIYDK